MNLSDLIEHNADAIIGRWSQKVAERLGLDDTRTPLLINDMPEVLGELVESMRVSPEDWRSTGAREHARQRVRLGVDIGGLAEEFAVIGETILELADEKGFEVSSQEASLMMRFLARGTSESVTEFARLTSVEMRRQSAEHFSFVAHELRTPLQSAQLALALVKGSGQEDGPMMRLEDSLSRLSNLIDNSLVDARLTAEPELRKEVTSSSEIVETAITYSSALARQRSIELKVEVEEFDFYADHKLMVSALTNLVVNGVKFSRPGGSVLIRASVRQERVHFEVSDSCGGLPEGATARMFQKFGQVGKDRTGSGLGLLIVKQAIEAHGGGVRVVDIPGQGCRMLMDLPRRQSRLSEAQQRDNQHNDGSSNASD